MSARPIRINFAPPSLRRTLLRTSLATRLLALAAIGLWIFLGISAANLIQEKNAVAAQLGDVLRKTQAKLDERAARQLVASKITIPETQALAVNKVIGQLNLPWRDLFDALEAATPASIALLEIEPDANKHLLRGAAEAKTSADMIGYIEALKKQSLFKNVELTKHEINDQDPNKPFRFQFEAIWNEEAR